MNSKLGQKTPIKKKEGATQEEIVETIGVSIVMGGGPSIVYGDKAYKVMKEMM